MENVVKVQLLYDDAKLPVRKYSTDAGMDIHSYEEVLLKAYRPQEGWITRLWRLLCSEPYDNEGHRAMIKTGIAFEIPAGTGMFIWDRSGLSAKHGIHRVAGVLDHQYKGELKIALINLSNKDYLIRKGDRIAQAIITPIMLPVLKEVESLTETARGADGFGSTGV